MSRILILIVAISVNSEFFLKLVAAADVALILMDIIVYRGLFIKKS